MARYRQVWDENEEKYVLVPVDEYALRREQKSGTIVKGKFDAFRSPIDGTLIRTQRQYDDHCKKHNVVPSAEFTPEWYAKKQKERAKVFEGAHNAKEQWRRKAEINELINHLERQNG